MYNTVSYWATVKSRNSYEIQENHAQSLTTLLNLSNTYKKMCVRLL